MAEPTSRELYDIINLMRVDIGVINTKMDFVMDTKKTADDAKQTASRAYEMAEDNEAEIKAVEERLEKKIDGIKKTAMWAIGLTITSILTATGIIVAIVF